MSKKKHREHMCLEQHEGLVSTSEYAVIISDLTKVIILNILYLGLILALYYYNRQSGFLDSFVGKLFNW